MRSVSYGSLRGKAGSRSESACLGYNSTRKVRAAQSSPRRASPKPVAVPATTSSSCRSVARSRRRLSPSQAATETEAETERIVQSRNAALEAELLEALSANSTRNQDKIDEETNQIIESCVAKLEKDGGLPNPTRVASINGRWRLLYTTRPGTSSPVQRAFTAIDSFRIYQDVLLTRVNGPQVNNVVVFGDSGELKVEAQAVTDALPLEGFVPRQKPGLSFLGKSSSEPPKGRDTRIDFQFTRAGFVFNILDSFLLKFPYPVPFRLLRDEGMYTSMCKCVCTYVCVCVCFNPDPSFHEFIFVLQ